MGAVNPRSSTPYWNVNMPPEERSVECPDFLRNLKQSDIDIIATPDAEYHILSWQEVLDYVAKNRLELFQRIPSDLRRYFAYNYATTQKYGSVMNFIIQQKLGWTAPVSPSGDAMPTPSSRPFDNAGDWAIRWNDWPYGIDRRIVHLVVWTKFELDEDPTTSDITPEARKMVSSFVDEVFVQPCGHENVIWFKNWKALKSVHAVEHFHVMIFDPDMKFIEKVTNGDVPAGLKNPY